MPASDLTTLARFKLWQPATGLSTPQLEALISSISAAIVQYLSRSVINQPFTESYNGIGGDRLMLRNYPVTQVSSLKVNGHAVAPSADGMATGYVLDQQDSQAGAIAYIGGCFPRGIQNVAITYRAGFQLSEPQSIPASGTIATTGFWRGDIAVTYADGTPLTRVASSPGANQYSVSADGAYSFNAGDHGKAILVTCGTVPLDIELACWEALQAYVAMQGRDPTVTERKAGDSAEKYRIASEDVAAIGMLLLTPAISMLLAPYRRVAMV